jgi:hypothetical protein
MLKSPPVAPGTRNGKNMQIGDAKKFIPDPKTQNLCKIVSPAAFSTQMGSKNHDFWCLEISERYHCAHPVFPCVFSGLPLVSVCNTTQLLMRYTPAKPECATPENTNLCQNVSPARLLTKMESRNLEKPRKFPNLCAQRYTPLHTRFWGVFDPFLEMV